MSIDTEVEQQDLDAAPEPENTPEPSLRETLESSMAEVSKDSSGVDPAPEKTAAERARDEAGRFAKGEKPPAAKVVVPTSAQVKPAAVVGQAKPAVAPVEGVKPPAEAPKAPQSWKPEARETWAKLPPAVQAEVQRRELEVQGLMQRSAVDKQVAGALRDAIAPYAGMIQADGSHPIQTVQRLLQTAAALRTAPAAHKAELVRTIADTYGVDLVQVIASAARAGKLNVEALDGAIVAALEGKAAPHQGPAFDPAAFKQQMRQEILGELGQRGEAAAAQRSASEVETFLAGQEFGNDVRGPMADYIEMRSRQGLQTTLEQAYGWAVSADEGLSKVIAQRKAAKDAATAQAATQRTRAASSSVQSRPAKAVGGKAPTTLRESLEAAYDAAQQG